LHGLGRVGTEADAEAGLGVCATAMPATGASSWARAGRVRRLPKAAAMTRNRSI